MNWYRVAASLTRQADMFQNLVKETPYPENQAHLITIAAVLRSMALAIEQGMKE